MKDKQTIVKSGVVLCLDALIYESRYKDYKVFASFAASRTGERLIISSYEKCKDGSRVCFL